MPSSRTRKFKFSFLSFHLHCIYYSVQVQHPMPRCPRCSKNFADESRVLKHMNQPVSSCLTYHQEVQRMNEAALAAARAASSSSSLLGGGLTASLQSSHSEQSHEIFEPLPDDTISTTAADLSSMDVDSHSVDDRHNTPFIEKYPGAGQTFGRAKTFMDTFDADCHADKRKDHPYYPFASRNEWEFASFLLRSNLSVNSIDRFLKLELVSGSVCFTFLPNI